MIIEKTYDLLLTRYREKLEGLTVSDVRIGFYLTAVRLSDNSAGVSATISENNPVCAKKNRDFGSFSPLKIKGQKVIDILDSQKRTGLILSLQNAVLNALSSGIIMTGKYNVIRDCDPIRLVDLNSRKSITIVGAFQSYIRKIQDTDNRLSVLEMNENALTPEQKHLFVPASEFSKIIPLSDVVIITGQTLVNRTIDELLAAADPAAQVIVTGPSGSIIPDILFENNVSIIGAMNITDIGIMFDVVSEGGTGFHLFEYCAEKICILKGDG